MARPLKPLVRGGGYYPSRRWTPLVYPGGYTTANGGGQPEPEAVLKTVTGSLIHITDALALPAEALTVNVEPIQAGAGDPSPDNVRPISGRTSATVTRTGKNLLNVADAIHNNYNIGSIPNTLKEGATYTYSINGTTTNRYRLYLSKSNAPLSAIIPLTTDYISAGRSQTFTAPSMDGYDNLCLAGSSNGEGNESLDNIRPQLELGSTASAYEPYAGSTYTIQLGDTVYGGTLDVTAGKMVVDRANIASYNGETLPGEWISDRDVYAPGSTPTIGAQVVYELATPIEITLTPTQIEMLLGENNLWSDAGDSTLTYYAEGEASTSEALGILLGGTYNNPGGADDVSDDEALGILLGGT